MCCNRSRSFLGIQKTCGRVGVSWTHCSANKVEPNLFCSCVDKLMHYITSDSAKLANLLYSAVSPVYQTTI